MESEEKFHKIRNKVTGQFWGKVQGRTFQSTNHGWVTVDRKKKAKIYATEGMAKAAITSHGLKDAEIKTYRVVEESSFDYPEKT